MALTATDFIKDQIKKNLMDFTENSFLRYYFLQVEPKVDDFARIIYLDWEPVINQKINGDGYAAVNTIPSVFNTLSPASQERLFPSWLDKYRVFARCGLTLVLIRDQVFRCESENYQDH